MLNGYFDSVIQNQGSTELNLRFYMPEKDNNKSKKYYSFNVHLRPIKNNVQKEILQKHIEEYPLLY